MIQNPRTEIEIIIIKGRRGFTLIEVLIAMAIFSIGILGVGSLQITSINNNAKARMRTEATILACGKIEELLSLQNYHDPLLDEDTHTDSSANNIYCIQWMAEEDYPMPSTKTISLSVRWTDGEAGCSNFDQKENQLNIDLIRADL